MGRLYDAFIEVGPRFTGMGDIKREGDKAGKEYGKALGDAAAKAAQANVRKLGEALAKARSAEADAAGKVRVAETQLAEARKKYGASTSQAVTAEERLASAQRKSAAAADTTKHATEALGKAQNQVGTAAADAGKRSGGRFTGAFKGSLSKIGGEKEGRQVATRFGVGMNGAIGSVVSRSAGIFVAGFAAIKSAQVFGSFIADARESAKVGRLTAQVILSTGGAAKITAAQVGDLATAISNKTGADDEAVQSGQNMLLTFTNVRNGVGKGNDIFNQASQAITDMTAAMNGGEVTADGMKTSSIQLGKALNDPIKGVTALSKVGVSFTEDQKKQIKTLVDSGKTMEAQKIILAELGKEFGGAAAAASDPLTKLKTIVGNASESIGGAFLPIVDKVATKLGTFIPAAIDKVTLGFSALKAAFSGEGITSDGFVGAMERIGVAARVAFDYFKTNVVPVLKDFGTFIRDTVLPAVGEFVTSLVQRLAPVLRDAFGYFRTDILPVLQEFATFFYTKILPAVSKFADYVVSTLVPVVQSLVTNGMDAAKAAIDRVKTAFQENEPQIRKFIGVVSEVVTWIAQKLGPVLGWLAGKQMKWVGDQIAFVITAIGKFVDAIAWVVRTVKDAGTKIAEVWAAVKSASQSALAFVVQKFLGFVGAMITGAAKAFGWVPKLGDKLKTAAAEFNTFKDKTNAALAGINDQTIKISPVVLAASAAHRNAVQDRIDRATGGPVFGPGTGTSDSIPANLSNGEHVWTAKEVQKAGGHGAVQQMRKSVMGYAKGGPVGLDVKGDFPYLGKSVANIASVAVAVARPIAQALGNAFAKINPGLEGVLKFVRSQVGKPYMWGGVGPRGYDCSGLVSAAINVARGKNPYSRLGATGSMPWSMFASGPGAFEVGWFKGNPGHTAATVNGTNIESAGGAGVRMGKSARGARNPLFSNRAHVKGFAHGGEVGIYDRGGRWPSGTLGVNLSGKTETVVPGGGTMIVELSPEDRALLRALRDIPLVLDGRRVDQQMSRRALGGGY